MKKMIVFLAIALVLCTGCSSKEDAQREVFKSTDSGSDFESAVSGADQGDTGYQSLFCDLTDTDPQTVMITINGTSLYPEQYFYWVANHCSSLEYNLSSYHQLYGSYADLFDDETGELLWDSEYADGKTLEEYALMEAESTMKFYVALEDMAAKYEIELDEEDEEVAAKEVASAMEELGGQEGFENYLATLGICQDTFEHFTRNSILFDKLLAALMDENHALYLPDEGYDQYAAYADHILLFTIDPDSGEPLKAKEKEEQHALAEDLLNQLRNADDPVQLFGELADEYSQDTGRTTNPTGYIYFPGTMVKEFEDAVASLEPGQISDIVESEYGYHIILRRDLNDGLNEDPIQKVAIAEKHLTAALNVLGSQAKVERNHMLDTMDIGTFYEAYLEAANERYMENLKKETEMKTEQ